MSDSDEDDEDGAPVMHLRQLALSCGVNRVRTMPQHPGIVASWGDNGQVSVSDLCFCTLRLCHAWDTQLIRCAFLIQLTTSALADLGHVFAAG